MARISQLLIHAENKPGTLATICSELAKVAVNISAIMAAHGPEPVIYMVAAPHSAAKKVLEALRIPYDEEDVIALRVTDRPGALGRATRKLADAGINVDYAYGSIVKGEERALIVMGVSDVEKATKLV